MKRGNRSSPYALPMTMVLMTAASWETIIRRTMMMAQGTCNAAEYWRMSQEKIAAAQVSLAALMQGRDAVAVMAPFVNRARANARRLRRSP